MASNPQHRAQVAWRHPVATLKDVGLGEDRVGVHVSRADVEDGLRWVADWHAGEFTPAHTHDGWSVEMHGLVHAYAELARSYLHMLTGLEHIRRNPHQAEYVTFELLGPCPSSETTVTEDDGESMIVGAGGWEVRVRFPAEHEDKAHLSFDRMLDIRNALASHGVETIWLQELVWIRAPHLLEGEELRSLGRRYERL